MRVYYDKKGIAKFISHKNLCKIFERALRRMEIPFKFTEGYHPHPKISFGPSLPVNMEGINEAFDLYLKEKINLENFINEINLLLPEGLKVKKCEWKDLKEPSINEDVKSVIYKIKDENVSLENIGEVIERDGKYVKIKTDINRFPARKIEKIFGFLPAEREILWDKE